MNRTMRTLLLAGLVLSLCGGSPRAAEEADAMADNPLYKFWADFKPGATSTRLETTTYGAASKDALPGGVEKKTVTHRLVNVQKDKVVVLTTVLEEDFLSTVESAPTRITYPAKVKKANLEAFLQEWGAKEGEDETIKVGGKEIVCKVRAGTQKVEGGQITFRICYSPTVPGGVVKHTRTTRDGDKLVAETTTTLLSFTEGKAPKSKERE